MKVLSCTRLALSVVLISCLCGMSFADFNAATFVSEFNAKNNGQGFRFTYTTVNGEAQLTQVSGTASIDLSAYNSSKSTGGTNYFRTFCNEPNQGVSSIYKGSLNYSNGVTKNSEGKAVKLGTAVLYSQFAAGTLANYAYTGTSSTRTTDAGLLKTALQATMGVTTVSNWNSNKYLAQLLAINSSQSYWTGAYDPNKYYAEVGDYAVFAMNNYSSSGAAQQDFFYVTKANYDNGVPEPATLLLWSVGGMSLAGASWRKRRITKK